MYIELIEHTTPAIAQQILELLVQAHAQESRLLQIGHALPLGQTADDIRASHDYYLGALIDGTLVGVLSVGRDDEPAQILIKLLVVHPSHQRQGIARALVTQAISLGRGSALTVVTAQANIPALALYGALGFTPYRQGILGQIELAMVKLRRPTGA